MKRPVAPYGNMPDHIKRKANHILRCSRELVEMVEAEEIAKKGQYIMTDSEKLKLLIEAVKTAVSEFDEIAFGHDGDCGSAQVIERLEEALEEITQ